VLTLEQLHRVLAFYLANRADVNAYLAERRRLVEAQQDDSRRNNADLIAKLRRAGRSLNCGCN